MSDFYKCKPSEIIHVDDEYTAFCFDEACLFISLQMRNGHEPTFGATKAPAAKKQKVARTPKEIYAKFDLPD